MFRAVALPLLGMGFFCVATHLFAETPVDYLREVRPLLSDACFACHGPDEASREADLRLDQLDEAIAGTDVENPILVRGEPERSELVRRITSDDPDLVMPPHDSGKSLEPEQIKLLRRWVAEGANWKQHWAFIAPERPALPTDDSTKGDSLWARGAIDAFILNRLEQEDMQPAKSADKEILIRRVTFDLTGLPPTLTDVEAFLADTSPQAYERVVDRLLQSPHYGEHMARYWLDAARYGDTHGLHLDNYREMWPYRDWVVQAFNRNKPFDQFVIEQLAGDLLEDPTLEQRVATGFCRAHVSTNEGGSIEQEVYTRNVVDRVSTTGTVFLGLTLGCCACHDHKFDPVTQQEFYQLFAFFNSLDGPAMDGNVKNPAPVISVPSDAQAANMKDLQEKITELRAQRDARQGADLPGFADWVQKRVAQSQHAALDSELHIADGLLVHCNFEEATGQQVKNLSQPERPGRLVGDVVRGEGPSGAGIQFRDKDSHLDLDNVGDFDNEDPFSCGAWVRTNSGSHSLLLGKTDASNSHRGYEVSLQDGRITMQISRRQPGYVIKVTTKEAVLPEQEWHHVFVTYNGSSRASGVTIYLDGEAQPTEVASDALQFKNGISNSKPLLVGNRDQGRGFAGGSVDDVRVYEGRLPDALVRGVYLESQLEFLSSTPSENWTDAQRESLRHFYLLRHDQQFADYTATLDQLLVELGQQELEVPTTLIFRERKKPREAFVLERGEYDKQGAQVERDTPASLPSMHPNQPRNRLGLAQWMVSDENPLVSRVAVNRFWQQLFGTGLVKTSDDFGNQGAVPSHPLLLDWLAVEFRESGWDVKALMKQIVLSATYRQSSFVTPELVQKDPENRLLARGPRFRLDAEVLRDQALAVSGLLVDKIGGPAVKPPQPNGLWKAVGFSNSNTVEFIADTKPEQIFRRSLYTFYKRTAPPPSMTTFDAPSRESSCVRRERTNTPLQSLLLLNDPQYVEAARALAMRIMRADLPTPGERAVLMYRLCTARKPSQATVNELVQLFESQLQRYQQDEAAAKQLLQPLARNVEADNFDTSRRASWTVVANLLLNLDEVVTKN